MIRFPRPTFARAVVAVLCTSHLLQADVTYTSTKHLADKLVASHGLSPIPWSNLNLNRIGNQVSDKSMRDRGLDHPHVAFKWQDDDNQSKDWYPQGIAGLRIGENLKFMVISWYAKNEDAHKGVRLSFVDVTHMNNIRYRHVMLVQPAESGSGVFEPILIHAGGLASIGTTIFVADTHNGVRVFDASMIFPSQPDPGKSKVGIIGGKAYAFDYRYILPQKGKYTLNGPEFSFLDLDWTVPTAPTLLSGTYHNPGEDNRLNALAWWSLSGDSIVAKLRDTRDESLSLKNRIQGAASLNSILYLGTSGGNAKLHVGTPPYTSFRSYSWPHGTEDLHVALQSGNLWCLSEHPGNRRVWAVKLARYTP